MKKLLLFAGLFCYAFLLFGQSDSNPYLSEDDPKVKLARKILEKITKIGGYKKEGLPHIVIHKRWEEHSPIGVAKYNYWNNRIELFENCFDSCLRWGQEDLLAYTIAHEFGHYLMSKEDSLNPQKACNHKDTLLEMKADIKGSFYARLAGYNACSTGELFFRNAYQYWVREDSAYPKTETRIRIFERSCERVDTLIQIFTLANYLMVLKQYDLATALFDELRKETAFPSREMFYNAGITRLKWVKKHNPKSLVWDVPLVFDDETKASKGGGISSIEPVYNTSEIAIKTKQYLEEATLLFEKAYLLDETYYWAYFYHASSLLLTSKDKPEKITQAELMLNKLKELAPNLNDYTYYLLSQISEKKNELSQAKYYFLLINEVCELDVPPSYIKKMIGDLPCTSTTTEKKTPILETWEEYEPIIMKEKYSLSIPYEGSELELEYGITSNNEYLCYRMYFSTHSIFILQNLNVKESLNSLHIGDSASQVQDIYGLPTHISKSIEQSYWVYQGHNQIGIRFDAEKKVTGWFIYKIQ